METCLERAAKLVDGVRQAAYGHPLDNFTHIADAANGLLRPKLKENLTPEDIARLMILVKMCRDMFMPKQDNVDDGAGYFRVIEKIRDERERRASYSMLDEVTKARFENDLNWADRAASAFGDTTEDCVKDRC